MKKKSNVYAILGFIFSLVIGSILGLIFSILGISEAKKNDGYLKGFAIAGVIISIARFVITVVALIILGFLIIKEPDPDYKCSLAYNCVDGLLGNYECSFDGESLRTTVTCSKEQVDKFNLKSKTHSYNKVDIFVFYGEGCPHCEHLFEYLSRLGNDPEYMYKFTIIKYNVWGNKDNLDLLYKAQDHFGLEHSKGVPFFIIGNNYYLGFGDPDNMSESTDKEFKEAIKNAYNNGYTNPAEYLGK